VDDAYSLYRGCLLGMAIGDALGCTVDEKNLAAIREDYGPNGLLGYDLVNGYADVTSHTQLAAFLSNGLLLAVNRGRPASYLPYVKRALSEWCYTQHARREPEQTLCWVSRIPALRRRRCMDTRMLDTVNRRDYGTPDDPLNSFATPGVLAEAVAVGLFFNEKRMDVPDVGLLAAQAAALTHGDRETVLACAALAYIIAGLVQEEDCPLQAHVLQAAAAVRGQFSRYPEAEQVASALQKAVTMTKNKLLTPETALERLECVTALQCLAGAVYTSLVHAGSFDAAMITAVNHSGRSAAVGAVTGAILGAKLGAQALPDFYLEPLECTDTLSQLAVDLAVGNPAAGLFDDDWDHKYVQGYPV